jgi:hypothetical protein
MAGAFGDTIWDTGVRSPSADVTARHVVMSLGRDPVQNTDSVCAWVRNGGMQIAGSVRASM